MFTLVCSVVCAGYVFSYGVVAIIAVICTTVLVLIVRLSPLRRDSRELRRFSHFFAIDHHQLPCSIRKSGRSLLFAEHAWWFSP